MISDTLVHLLRDNYLEAKIRGKKSFLLQRQQLLSLAEIPTLSDIVAALADGPYGSELSKLQEVSSAVETERAIQRGFASSVNNLVSGSKGNVRQFLLEYVRRFDAYDLATLVMFKSQGKTWEEFSTARQPLGGVREGQLRRLYMMDDLRESVRIIGDKTLEERTGDIDLEEMPPEKAALVRDIFTGWGEERFYNYVVKRLHGRDRSSCLPIVGATVDLLNLSIVLRSKLIGVSNVEEHLVPVHWRLDKQSIGRLLATTDLDETLEKAGSLTQYSRLMANARQRHEETKSLAFLEMDVKRYLVGQARRIFLGFPYTIGVVLAFLIFKENEARGLAAVISGVASGLKPDQVKALITV